MRFDFRRLACFQVISTGDKTFRIMVGGREEVISIDRLKQAHVDLSGPVKLALPPRRGRPPQRIPEKPHSRTTQQRSKTSGAGRIIRRSPRFL
ncbi:transposon Ty3-G Gag-Pol polyprotein [Elysia marginata]|uniref:Transposon Ty3-G Gag-Pol polyprotein n=1 Tax=Elysia marginata TaxID=1093978 RepID=A0AAV4H3T6_9GAST|nr:transposon Ty3-G Gag-Pol polyprotein [Elysia marginata]